MFQMTPPWMPHGAGVNILPLTPSLLSKMSYHYNWQKPSKIMRKIVTPIPKGRFIVHHIITQKRVFFFSFNIEGGGYCGIVQMSVQIFCVEIVLIWKSTVKDTSTNSIKDDETFNKYVNPGEGAHGIAAVLRSMAFTTKIQRFLRLKIWVWCGEFCTMDPTQNQTQ